MPDVVEDVYTVLSGVFSNNTEVSKVYTVVYCVDFWVNNCHYYAYGFVF